MSLSSGELSRARPVVEVRPPGPFLKWAGGKGQLLGQMAPHFPKEYRTYFEPFLGGGAVFFHLQPEKALLADLNPDLVNAFQVVRDHPAALMEALDHHAELRMSEEYLYEVRRQEVSALSSVERAARTIFLNKTCFNGLYRVNSRGGFNVPRGGYPNPTLYDRVNLLSSTRTSKAESFSSPTIGKPAAERGRAILSTSTRRIIRSVDRRASRVTQRRTSGTVTRRLSLRHSDDSTSGGAS